MTKYSKDFKFKVVQYYLSGYGFLTTGKHFDVDPSNVKKWVRHLEHYGIVGLEIKNTKARHSQDFKFHVIQSMLADGLSLQDAAQQFHIRQKETIRQWLLRYEEHGIDGLKPKPKGRSRPMPKQPQVKPTQADRAKSSEELLEELAYLRAENAFLKKLRALILEQQAQEQAQQRKLQDLYQD